MIQSEMICSGASVEEDPYDYVRRKSAEITYTIRPCTGEEGLMPHNITSKFAVIHDVYVGDHGAHLLPSSSSTLLSRHHTYCIHYLYE
jgi:hypothetical protein